MRGDDERGGVFETAREAWKWIFVTAAILGAAAWVGFKVGPTL